MPESERLMQIRAGYEAFARGDPTAFTSAMSGDVEYHNPDEAIEGGVRRGLETVESAVGGLLASFDWHKLEIEEMVEEGDRVAVKLRGHAIGRESGAEVDLHISNLITYRRGRVVAFEWFNDPEGARRALAG